MHAKWPGQLILPHVQRANFLKLTSPLQSLESKNLDGNRKPSFVTGAEFAVADPQHEFRRRRLFPGHGTWGNSAVCASHVKGQHLPVDKVNRTQKQLPQPSGTIRIFEVINGGWNKERHLQQGACSAYLGIRSNMFSINGPGLLSSLMALRVRHTQSTSVFSTLECAVQSTIRYSNSAETQNCFVAYYCLCLTETCGPNKNHLV